MKCNSGKHDWDDELDARRCCSRMFSRQIRRRGEEGDMAPDGRRTVIRDGVVMTSGWVATPAGHAITRVLSGIPSNLPAPKPEGS